MGFIHQPNSYYIRGNGNLNITRAGLEAKLQCMELWRNKVIREQIWIEEICDLIKYSSYRHFTIYTHNCALAAYPLTKESLKPFKVHFHYQTKHHYELRYSDTYNRWYINNRKLIKGKFRNLDQLIEILDEFQMLELVIPEGTEYWINRL